MFSTLADKSVGLSNARPHIAFNLAGRKWASIMVDREIEAAPYEFNLGSQCLSSITFQTDFITRDNPARGEEFDTIEMAKQFSSMFGNQALTVGQLFGFAFQLGKRQVVLELTVKELVAINSSMSQTSDTSSVEIGLTTPNTVVMFERKEGSDIKLVGKLTGSAPQQIFTANWDFSVMGIGGLDEQFNQIFRRAFSDRLLPPRFAEKAKIEYVKGIILHGPPGTGKTLIARQIGKMLMAREPKIVNGPSILDKFVGESEANIRRLFKDAEDEQAKCGRDSGLHMIIFDEIDAICKARGSAPGSAGVGDTVVNQLLSLMDGVNSLTNVLVIGMTNRLELIDEALLRPGRFEVQLEIGLPSKQGRYEIFTIHTRELSELGVLDPAVDLHELAELSKNFTGAEIAGLIRAARTRAVTRMTGRETKMIEESRLEEFKITKEDFYQALKEDVKPRLGKSEDLLKDFSRPIIVWDPKIEAIQYKFTRIISRIQNGNIANRPQFIMLRGDYGSGLTTLAANLASQSEFPFITFYQSKIARSEMNRMQLLDKTFKDASQSELSCIVLDNLESIFGYELPGPTFSRDLAFFFKELGDLRLPKSNRMLVICTCRSDRFMEDTKIMQFFNQIIDVPSVTTARQVESVLNHLIESSQSPLAPAQAQDLCSRLEMIPFVMGIKKLESLVSEISTYQPEEQVDEFIELMHSLRLIS